jgi:hypothetical protein
MRSRKVVERVYLLLFEITTPPWQVNANLLPTIPSHSLRKLFDALAV